MTLTMLHPCADVLRCPPMVSQLYMLNEEPAHENQSITCGAASSRIQETMHLYAFLCHSSPYSLRSAQQSSPVAFSARPQRASGQAPLLVRDETAYMRRLTLRNHLTAPCSRPACDGMLLRWPGMIICIFPRYDDLRCPFMFIVFSLRFKTRTVCYDAFAGARACRP